MVDLSFQFCQACDLPVDRAWERPLLVVPRLVTHNLVLVEQNMELSSNRIHRYSLYEKTSMLPSNAEKSDKETDYQGPADWVIISVIP